MELNQDTIEKVVDILNGLLHINNDRIAGYHQAAQEIKDEDLQIVFSTMLNESVNFAENLAAYIRDMGAEPTTKGTIGGNIHQAWLNLKAAIVGNDRAAILASCEFGDSSALQTYDEALATEEIYNNEELRGVLQRQRENLENSLKIIQSISTSTQYNKAEQETLKIP